MGLLRRDLTALKLSHPKAENVTFTLFHNGLTECQFLWPETTRNGLLHKQLLKRLRPEKPEDKQTLQEMLASLSINNMTLRVIEHGSHGLSRSAPTSPQKRLGTFRNNEPHRDSGDEPQLAIGHHSLLPRGIPSFPARAPEASIPPMTMQEDSIASSTPSSPVPSAKSPLQDERQAIILPIENSSPDVPSAGLQPTQPEKPPLLNQSVTSIPYDLSSQNSITQPLMDPVQTCQVTSTIQRPLKRSRSPSPPGKSSHPFERRSNPSELSQIQSLTRELWDIRRQLTASVAKEQSIISELRKLDSTFGLVPQESTQMHTNGSDSNSAKQNGISEFVPKTRLEMVEQELREERKQRIQAVQALKDIRQECREPFVVPALLEAFLMISDVTSQAMSTAV